MNERNQVQEMTTEMTTAHVVEPLNDAQIRTLELVKDQADHNRLMDELECSSKKVYRILKGLYGNIQGVPTKWQVENPYLKLRDEPEKASLKYELNSRGWKALFVEGSLSENDNNQVSEEIESSDGSVPGEVMLRPHYLRSKHMIRRTGGGDDSWFVELSKHFDSTEDGSGFCVYWREFRAEVYRGSIQIRLDMPMERVTVEEMFSDYLELRDRFISHVVQRLNGIKEGIGIQVRSNPELVEASVLTQEWAEFDSAFANWFYDNREELQSDGSSFGGLFEVRNERGDRIAHIDCSEGVPEFEWVDSQEAKNHLQNMKDLVRWGASQEITPQDFSNLSWLRENFEFFNSFYDRLSEQDEIQDRLDDLEKKMALHDGKIEAHSKRLKQVDGKIGEQDERIEDCVQRVQGVQFEQSELRGNQEELVSALDTVFDAQSVLVDEVGELQSSRTVLAEGIESNSRTNRRMAEAIEHVGGNSRSVQRLAESNHELIREVRKERLTYRVKKGLKQMGSMMASVLGGII